MLGAVQDLMTPANFCEDWLRGFGVARGRIVAFSIDLLRSPLKHSRTTDDRRDERLSAYELDWNSRVRYTLIAIVS